MFGFLFGIATGPLCARRRRPHRHYDVYCPPVRLAWIEQTHNFGGDAVWSMRV